MTLPRLFVASAEPPREVPSSASDLAQLVGVIGTEDRGGSNELVMGATIDGDLVALPADQRSALAPTLQAVLAHHEVARHAEHPTFLAEELFLLRVDLLEEAPDAPGLNDPVYLYGTLCGPFPRSSETRSVRGQLTVTRGDVLSGFAMGSRWPFHLKRTDRSDYRCFFGLLPGDRAEEIARGRGVVLALPLLSDDLLQSPGNELWVAQILYDLLDALQEELRALKSTSAFSRATIPVPSREAFIRALEADGFTVEGDEATRDAKSGGLVSRLFRGRERVTIPKQATIEELFDMARLALADLGDPAGHGAALAKIATSDRGTRRALLAGFASDPRRLVATHARSGAPPIAVTTDRPAGEGVARRAPKSEWIRDFVEQHQAPDRKQPRLSSPTRARPPDEGAGARPDWMKDFEIVGLPG